MNILVTVLILVVLIIAIVAVVVFLRNKKSVTSQQPPITPMSSPTRPEVRHEADEPIPTLSPSQSTAEPQAQQRQQPQQPNYLEKAQQFINQQRYDDAAQELKRGLTANPSDGDLLLKLLNVYAIDSRHDDFHQLYQKIQAQSNPAILKEADKIKSLIDEEQAATTTPPSASAPTAEILPDDDDGLDFDLSLGDSSTDDDDLMELGTSDDSSNASKAHQQNDELNLSFDDLESQLLTDDETSTLEVNTTKSTKSDDGDNDALELTLDGLEGIDDDAKAELATQTEPTLSLDGDDLDNNNNDTAPKPSAKDEQPLTLDIADIQDTDSNELDDNLQFDWGLEEDDNAKQDSKPQSSPQTAKETNKKQADDLQLDWGLEDEPKSSDVSSIDEGISATPAADNAPVDKDSDSIDDALSFNIDDSEEVGELTSAKQPVNELTLDELTVDEIDTADAPSHDKHDDAAISFEDFDLGGQQDDADANKDDSLEGAVQSGIDSDVDSGIDNEADAMADFDFGLQAEPEKQDSPKTPATTDDSSTDGLDDFGDFSAIEAAELGDIEADKQQQDSSPVDDTADEDSVLGNGVEDTLSQLDALSLDDGYDSTDAIETTKDETVTDSAPVTDKPAQEAATTEPTTPKVEPKADQSTPVVAPDAEQFSSDFGFVSELDGPQVTLTLAVQYLELGEYESAKRLLHEVIEQGDSQQKDLAQELLEKTV